MYFYITCQLPPPKHSKVPLFQVICHRNLFPSEKHPEVTLLSDVQTSKK